VCGLRVFATFFHQCCKGFLFSAHLAIKIDEERSTTNLSKLLDVTLPLSVVLLSFHCQDSEEYTEAKQGLLTVFQGSACWRFCIAG
jgi:hypothetical protein